MEGGSVLRLRVRWGGPLVTSASLPRAVGLAFPGKGPSKTHGPNWAGVERRGARALPDSSTPEATRKTETKDGLLLRGACGTKTMHAKRYLGDGGEEEEEQEIKRQIQLGCQLPSLRGLLPLPGPVSQEGKRSSFKEHQGRDIICLPKDSRRESGRLFVEA